MMEINRSKLPKLAGERERERRTVHGPRGIIAMKDSAYCRILADKMVQRMTSVAKLV